jgi:hypothetical protein
MDFNSSIDIIIRDLRDARQIIDDLKGTEGVPLFQMELAKAKVKSAEELIALLKTGNSTKPDQPKQENVQVPSVQKRPPEKIIELSEDTESAEAAKPEPKMQADKPVLEIKTSENQQPLIREVETESKPDKGFQTESAIIADRFSDKGDRLNEQLGGLINDSSFTASVPVTNLSNAIGINDRFLFVREIFGGDQSAYNTAIEQLNGTANAEEALKIISRYQAGNSDSAAVKQLMEIVKRKFTTNV